MYRRGSGRSVLLVSVYVNDLIITGAKEREVEAFKAQMKKTFDMSNLGLLSFYLGVEVHQDSTGITLRQTHYAKRILELGGMADCNPTHTPMEERLRLSRHSTTAEVDPTHYRRLIGSLRYLVHTRPSLAFAVGFVSQYIATSTAATQALWLSKLLAEVLGRHVEVVELKVDSKSALALAKNPVFHERSKHIRIKYHFIRSCLEDGSIKAEYIFTTDQLADILTKSLDKTKFEKMRGRIGLKQIIPKAHKAKGKNGGC
jgi:hypothetical protein